MWDVRGTISIRWLGREPGTYTIIDRYLFSDSGTQSEENHYGCLLYTSDAADE